jgi:hypothetical protein
VADYFNLAISAYGVGDDTGFKPTRCTGTGTSGNTGPASHCNRLA